MKLLQRRPMCLSGSLCWLSSDLCVWVTLLCSAASGMSNSLWPHGLQPARLLCPWDFPVKNTGVGFHALLQGIFPTQGLDPGLPHCRQILGVTLEYMNSVPPLWGLLLHQAPHTQAHTHTHMRTHVHTRTHTGARTQQTGHLNYVKLYYFYISHLSSLTTLIKLEFDTTLTDKIRLCKVVSKNSSL